MLSDSETLVGQAVGPPHSLPAAFFQGYPLSLSASSPTANLSIPYPETDNWYLSLQVLCPKRPE